MGCIMHSKCFNFLKLLGRILATQILLCFWTQRKPQFGAESILYIGVTFMYTCRIPLESGEQREINCSGVICTPLQNVCIFQLYYFMHRDSKFLHNFIVCCCNIVLHLKWNLVLLHGHSVSYMHTYSGTPSS